MKEESIIWIYLCLRPRVGRRRKECSINMDMDRFTEIVGPESIRTQEPMSRHTTFRIGGPADVFVTPKNSQDLAGVLAYCKEEQIPYFILGNGSNLLVPDEGFRGVIICTRGLDFIQFQDTRVTAGSGMLLSRLAALVSREGLTGLEFASGIPGTLGGAVTMNAGAYGGEIKDCIVSAEVMDKEGNIFELQKDEMELSYRNSIIQRHELIVLAATFEFQVGDLRQIHDQIQHLNQQRRMKQPLEYGSAGSTFKRPEGYFAGKLIQDAGLRGYRVGDVMVSEKHCGFVVNVGEGTYADAMKVIHHVQEEVKAQFGVDLELEVKTI